MVALSTAPSCADGGVGVTTFFGTLSTVADGDSERVRFLQVASKNKDELVLVKL